MEAVRISETSVYSNETTHRYIPEGTKSGVAKQSIAVDFFSKLLT
jgi:hypothetical protein